MKQFKKLVPAMLMLLVSASMLGTSTYAWFSMNTSVQATGMQVQAVAEDGIVISNSSKTSWSNTATAQVTSASLVPTSAAATTTPAFVHNSSTNADQAQGGQAAATYTDLSLTWNTNGTEGIGYDDADSDSTLDSDEKSYVLLNNFYIKSSGATITGKTLYINDVSVTSSASVLAIDNSLRVLVVVGSTAYVYAPVINAGGGTTTLSYNYKETTPVTALNATAQEGYDKSTGITTIPNTDADAINAKIYIYFEGEDANCKSTNISGITVDTLTVTVNFGIEATHPVTP